MIGEVNVGLALIGGAFLTMGLPGRDGQSLNNVRVEASTDSWCLRREPWDNSYQFTKGEGGVLTWKKRPEVFNAYSLFVIWDNDPSHQSRQVLFDDIAVTSLENPLQPDLSPCRRRR